MTSQEFKKAARILKETWKELEKEALANGVDIFSPEYKDLQDKTREKMLATMGFTLEEYQTIKSSLEKARVQKVNEKFQEVEQKIEEVKAEIETLKNTEPPRIPTEEEIKELAKSVIPEPPAPVIKTEVVEKIIVEKPKIVKETVKETIKVEYDDKPLKEDFEKLSKKLENLPRVNEEKLKEDLNSNFSENFKKNIDILGMPDFRKLAMGLQDQIDTVNLTLSSLRTGFTKLTATGDVNGSNTVFTFTEKPTYIVSDHAWYSENNGWTWDTLTATLTIPPNDEIYGFV